MPGSRSSPDALDSPKPLALEDYVDALSQRRPSQLRIDLIDLLRREREPRSPYALARRLSASRGRTTHANSLYRILDELLAAGIVLKVVARPGFMISPDPSQAWSLLLCNVCGVVIPFAADAADVEFADLAAAAGFTPARRHIEVTGTCSACQ